MNTPDNLKYTKDHEWVKVVGKQATIGITDHAQEQLGDVVFVELPDGTEVFSKGDSMGVIESVKAVSDVYAPVSGEIIEINEPLKDNPERFNEDCYGEAWIAKFEIANMDEIDELLTHEQYIAFVAEETE